ncbi:MAG: ATP-binding protein [Alphaproteobacteria bacterium]
MSFAPTRLSRSEGFRLSAIFAGVFVLCVSAMAVAVSLITTQALRDQVVQYARADVAAIQGAYQKEGLNEALEVTQQIMAAPGGSDFFLLQKNGDRLEGNLPVMSAHPGITTLSSPDREILGVGAEIAPGLYAFSGGDLSRVQATRRRIFITLCWLLGVGVILAIAGGALVSRTFLTRTDIMARACRAIMDGDIRARIPVRGSGDELDRLATVVNQMLDRIAALMDNLRQVTSDIAHDLRTPVTLLRTRLERAKREARTNGEYQDALQGAIDRSDEILQQFAALLRIAQIEGGARRAGFTRLPLGPLLVHMAELFGAVAEESGHQLETGALAEAVIRGDRELLVQLLSNLVENAIIHTPSGTRITLSLEVADGQAIVRVHDNGPGVPREEHDKLFRRLYRCEASRTRPGYGLGLSLVAAVAELHGARAQITERGGTGLCIEVVFPLAVN